MNLTDTQLILLSDAARRDGIVALPNHLKGGAATKVVDKLLAEGLIEEFTASAALPIWRRDDEEGNALALRITDRGLRAIGVGEGNPGDGGKAASDGAKPKANPGKTPLSTKRRKARAGTRKKAPRCSPGRKTPVPASAGAHSTRTGSKQAKVITMLQSSAGGATVSAIMKATGWQAHSVRGLFSGVIRKKLGLRLESNGKGDARVYRIVSKDRSLKRRGK